MNIALKLMTTALVGIALTGCSAALQTNDDNLRVVKINAQEKEQPIDAYNRLALQYIQIGNATAAKSAVQRALHFDPNNGIALNSMALILQSQNDVTNADMYFNKAIQNDPENPMIRNNYGAFLYSIDVFPSACAQFEQAATLDLFYQGRAQAFENLGLCQLKLNNTDLAENAFKRSIEINPRTVAVREYLTILQQKNDPDYQRIYNRLSAFIQ